MDMKKTGQLIAHQRNVQGLTQQQLACQLNITGAAVSKWERGLSFPDAALWESLSEILGVSVLELVRGEQLTSYEISAEEADQSVRDALRLTHTKLDRDPTPASIRNFFKVQTYQQFATKLLFIMGIITLFVAVCLWVNAENTLETKLIVGGVSIALLLAAAVVWRWEVAIRRRNEMLRDQGIEVAACITRISRNYLAEMPFQKNSHPYRLTYEYEVAGKLYTGRSNLIWEYPLLSGELVPVYVDPDNPDQHFMDTSFATCM